MDIATGSWFKYLNEEILTEGLRDIGLPERIVDFIENAMANAPEKAKMYAGNQWKAHSLPSAYTHDVLKKRWRTFMEENFEDEIQVQLGPDPDSRPEMVARTITPYRVDRDVGPQQRKQYDDEMIERNKKIVFVFQNVNAAWGKPAGTWRKSFMKAVKALSKAGVESEKAEKVKNWLQTYMMQEFRSWYSQYNELFDWLNDEPTNYELVKNEDDINSAYNTAKEDLENREEPENVLHQFEDGSYWYNLDVSSCGVEGERMGHCGSDSRGVLVSLRKRQGNRKASSSYVTMTWEDEGYGGNYLYQIKGRSNEAPPDEVWDHINWFIKNMGITIVQEDGEHSRDPDEFREMLDYLQQQNPGVSFTGVVDEQAIQEALDEVENEYEDDNSSINAEVMGPDEHGGEGTYIYMNAYCNLQIDLGWPDIVRRDNDFYPSVEAGSGDYDDNFHPIPGNTWGSEARDFSSEIEIDAIEWDLPGEGETEWDVRMLTGAQPEGEDINPDAPQTAHLEIEIRMTHQEGASDPDEAKWEFEQFAAQVKENFADAYDEIKEKVRRNLVDGEFMGKSAFDRTRNDLSATDLKHWQVYEDGGTVEFWFRLSENHASAVNNLGGELGAIPNEFKMWAFDEGQEGMIDGLYSKMFGSTPVGPSRGASRIENPQLSQEMSYALKQRYGSMEGADGVQQQLSLGDRYKQQRRGPPWSSVLQSNSRFIIIPESSLSGGGYRKQLVNYKFEIFVDARSPEDRIEAVKAMVKYFNDNPDIVEDAAEDVIGTRFRTIKALAAANKDEVLSGKRLEVSVQRIDSMYAAQVASGSDEWAERAVATAKWIRDNWGSMEEVERWVGYYKYVLPLALRRLNFAMTIPSIEMDDPDNYGKPSTWNQYVKEQLNKLGAFGGTVRDYSGVQRGETQAGSVGEPRPAQESHEKPWKSNIERDSIIDEALSLIKEKDPGYDLRVYQVLLKCSMAKEAGGQRGETETEIRGIEGVTVVRAVPESQRQDSSNYYSTLKIKFELEGTVSRVRYVNLVLLPGILKIKGLKVLPGGISAIEQISGGISEGGGGARIKNLQGPLHVTPRPQIEDVVGAWSASGEAIYDVPYHTANMGYHTMVGVDELWKYCSSPFYRNTKRDFDHVRSNLIKNGPLEPIMLAVGKNGRAKITHGIDTVFAAKDIGLEELPVIFNYQKQV